MFGMAMESILRPPERVSDPSLPRGTGFRVPVGCSLRSTPTSSASPNLRLERSSRAIGSVLVPTDFSDCAAHALHFAVGLVSAWEAELTILHVIDINAQPARGEVGTAQQLMSWVWSDGISQMSGLVKDLGNLVNAKPLFLEGVPWEQAVDQSRRFDLLVLGVPRTKQVWKVFSRGTALRIIRDALCPVLVVKPW
jgi:universal stress protein A